MTVLRIVFGQLPRYAPLEEGHAQSFHIEGLNCALFIAERQIVARLIVARQIVVPATSVARGRKYIYLYAASLYDRPGPVDQPPVKTCADNADP